MVKYQNNRLIHTLQYNIYPTPTPHVDLYCSGELKDIAEEKVK